MDPNPDPIIDKYRKEYQAPKHDPRSLGDIPDREPLAEQSTWDDFVAQLRALDDYWNWKSKGRWNVFGDTHSWIHTITTGREVVRLPDWGNLTQRECYILRGRDREEGFWGLLGDFEGSGLAKSLFSPDSKRDVGPVRMQLRGHVNQVLNADDYNETARCAHAAVQEIKEDTEEFRGLGVAVATRLFALARPDCLVSVNGLSAAGLVECSGLPVRPKDFAENAKRYDELLNWVYEQPWFNSARPDDPSERTIWNNRAALLDAFVYEEKGA